MNSEELPGLYLHVPFCRSKCFYCDFYSLASRSLVPAWLEAVRTEMTLYRQRFKGFDSFYLGGGTPSVLEERELAALFESLLENFTFGPAPEMTMEANPESLSPDKLKTVKDFGVNRISLGVQSLDDRDLKYLGRGHCSARALEAFDACRSAGFENVSVDLIYGLEIQTLQGWKRTLDQVMEFRPEHISCYQLTFEKGATLWKMRKSGRLRSVGEKLEAAFFIWTSRYLQKRGYYHYEVSNFAAERQFMCRHNRKYWRHAPYLGLGPSAHSAASGEPPQPSCAAQRPIPASPEGRWACDSIPRGGAVGPPAGLAEPPQPAGFAGGRAILDGAAEPVIAMTPPPPKAAAFPGLADLAPALRRWWNVRSVREYCKLLAEGKTPVVGSEILSREQFRLEEIDLALRTDDGLDMSVLKDLPHSQRVLAQWQKSGLIRVSEGRARPTRKGFLVADSLALMLMDA